MSWENVTGVKYINIWTGYSDTTQGHLFVNGNHQLLLTAGITFNLKSGTTEGPTQDEVAQALSLINNQDGGPLKYLAVVDENIYTALYDPNHVQAEPVANPDSAGDGIYDYTFQWYVNSSTAINKGFWSEGVALKLVYSTDGSNSVVVDTSVHGSSTKANVTVCCYQPVLYGNKGENRINISISSKQVASSDCSDKAGNFNHAGDTFIVYWVYIDDSYFKLFNFDGCTDPDPDVVHQGFYIHKEKSTVEWDHVFNSFFPNVKCGAFDFSTQVAVRSGPDQSYPVVVTEQITVHQQENQITFISGFSSAQGLKYAGEVDKRQAVLAYDQFGNSTYFLVHTTYDYKSDGDSGHIVMLSVS